ncbi:MAG: FlgD immunoglobulin-like domain containing protein [candidate division WOR-3 bacterium]
MPFETQKVGPGGALAVVDSVDTLHGTMLYALRGKNSPDFWRYDIERDSWEMRESIPMYGRAGSKRRVKEGGTLVAAPDGRLYATKGRCHEFWRYDVARDSWTQMADVPGANKKPGWGAAACCITLCDDSKWVYFLRGSNTCEFYRYSISGDSWHRLADAPSGASGKKFKAGTCMTTNGQDTIFVLKGVEGEFYVYDAGTGAWTAKSSLPQVGRSGRRKKPGKGAALTWFGGKAYALKGSGTNELWVHNYEDNSWRQANDVPAAPSGRMVKAGGSIVAADNYLWVLKGNNTPEFCRFAPNRVLTAPGQEIPIAPGAMELLIAEGTDCAEPRLSYGGDRVAFVMSGSNGRAQVHVASSTGGNVLELTALEGECRSPVWSPDPADERIAFIYEPEDSCAQIAVVSSQGGAVTRLVKGLGDIGTLAWAPDGKCLVFDCDSGDWVQLWRYTFSDSSVQVLTTSEADHHSPVFASDAVVVFALETQDGLSQIGKLYQYAPDTATSGNLVWVETTLTTAACDHANPCVAASAGLVFFEVESDDGYTMIGRVTLGGDSEAVITSGNCDFELPTTGPTGETLYCLRSTDAGAAICEVLADGSGYEDKTDDEVERETPHARQDQAGACAVYVRDGSIYRTRGQGERGQQGSGSGVFALDRIAPNPSRGRVGISWQVPRLAQVSLKLYDPSGRLVRTLESGERKPGRYVTVWDGTDATGRSVTTGIYFARLRAADQQLTRKVVLQR